MRLYTVVVSYERLGLLKATISSYLDTVTLPHELIVVDNGSSPTVTRWLARQPHPLLLLAENHYPGYACNRGFDLAPPWATLLHRSDSDMEYLPGWCDALQERLDAQPFAAIVGLRTDEEELHTTLNTGGTAVIRRHVWDEGLRYVETPWVDDMTEDWRICQDARRMGYQWTRVQRPCVVHLGAEHARADDPYYQRSFGVRGIEHLLP